MVPNVNSTLSAAYANLREADVARARKNKILQKSGLHNAGMQHPKREFKEYYSSFRLGQ